MIKPKTIVFDSEMIKYQVQNFLGSGSFGEVYSIKRKDDGKIFALKTIPTPFVDETILQSFINEGKTAIGISHPNVIMYYYFHDGSTFPELPLYIIMEYAKGGTLEKKINELKDEKKFYSNEELILMFSQLIAGMKAINSKLIHRDIKPDNILIDDENLKISDFGLSKFVSQATRSSTFKGFGCLQYLAPEGWKFDKNTIQMDIYSMGLVFYELASLEHPYHVLTPDINEWRNAHLLQQPRSLKDINKGISPILSRLISKMVEKDIAKRSKNWDEVSEDLSKEMITPLKDSEIIMNVLRIRNEKEQQAIEARLNNEKKQKEKDEFKNLILSQFHKDIINPLKEFIDELNQVSDKQRIIYHFNPNSFLNTIEYSSQRIKIELEPILEENFYKVIEYTDFGMRQKRKELRLPRINEKRVLAWGLLKANDGKGFNLILLENPDSIYGIWLLLFNRHRTIVVRQDNRPDPFPFEIKELGEEIEYLNAMHIYISEKFSLELEKIKNFLSSYFV